MNIRKPNITVTTLLFLLLAMIACQNPSVAAELEVNPIELEKDVAWVHLFGGVNQNAGGPAPTVRIGPDGFLYAAGRISDSTENWFLQSIGKEDIITQKEDLFLAKFNRLGKCLWFKTFGGDEGDDYGSFEIDRNGNLLVGGVRLQRFNVELNNTPMTLPQSGWQNYTWRGTLRFNQEGQFQEAYSWQDLDPVMQDSSGGRYTFESSTANGLNSATDFVRYDANGIELWRRTFRSGK